MISKTFLGLKVHGCFASKAQRWREKCYVQMEAESLNMHANNVFLRYYESEKNFEMRMWRLLQEKSLPLEMISQNSYFQVC